MFFVPSNRELPDSLGNDAGALVPSLLSRDISDYPEGIVLPVDKPYRWTSADVIRKLKYAAIRHFGKKNLKVGHAGTLDPLATGVLLVCIGPACRQAQQLQDHDKEYIARIRFGATTPSYDLEKEVDRLFPYEHITREAVTAALPSFLGEQEQIAPLFSAKSVDGVRAYELARKLYRHRQSLSSASSDPASVGSGSSPGTPTDLPGMSGNLPDFDAAALDALHRSKIVISELQLLDFAAAVDGFLEACPSPDEYRGRDRSEAESSGETSRTAASRTASSRINVADTSALRLPEAVIRIVCSKGTYIRAFARDLGEALGSGAHLGGLIRSRSGAFSLSSALTLDQALALLS